MGQLCSKGLPDIEPSLQTFDLVKEDAPVTAAAPVGDTSKAKHAPRHKAGDGPTADSATSLQGRTFLTWAEEKSKEQDMTVCEFLMDAFSIKDKDSDDSSDEGSSVRSIVRQVAEGSPPRDTQCIKWNAKPQQPHCTFACGAPQPACQPDRVKTAVALNDLRVTRDDEVESVLRLLCNVFDVETAAVTLLTGQAVWIPYICGAVPPGTCPPRWGFCGWSFMNANHELLVIENSREDVRLSQNFFVVEPAFSLVFYVAAPLISSNGHRLGTLCIFGQEPRKFDATRAQLLANMAELLVRQFERNWVMQLQEQNHGAQLQRSLAVYESACLVVDVSRASWSVLHMNPAAIDQLGVEWEPCAEYLANHPAGKMDRKPWQGVPFDTVFEYPDSVAEWASGSWEFVLRGVRGSSSNETLRGKLFDLHFRLAISDGLDQDQPFYVGVPSWLPLDNDNFGRTYFFVRVEDAYEKTALPEVTATGLPPVTEGVAVEDISLAVSSRHSLDTAHESGHSSSSGSRRGSGDVAFSSSGTRSSSSISKSRSRSGTASASSSCSVVSGTVWLPRGPNGPMGCPIEGLVLGPLVGKGAYGRVYRGVYQGAPVAVKIIDDVTTVKRDKGGVPLEAALTSGMGHLGVMRTLSWAFGEEWLGPSTTKSRRTSLSGRNVTGANCWMVMEYCDMGCIADAVIKGWFRSSRNPTEGGTNLRTVAVTAYEVASAMQYLHSHGVLHGDLCGGNVMLTASDVYKHGFVAKVGDFGLAREASAKPRSGSNMYGTVTHMPPEVLMDGGLTKATDVYSFGVLLWEMLTGTWAWAGLRHAQIICQVALLKHSLAIPAGLPKPLEKLLRSCLAQNPAARPSFEQCVHVLSTWLQSMWNADQDDLVLMLNKGDADAPDMAEFKNKAGTEGDPAQ